ncbi:Hypothetical_protein [Hexamita inflata]|uniref:Hypothetical_protein n=1 Tax=Hexamita inflata TaxID=28002 RepID=A0ABP1HLH9_9EUKA
MFWMRMKCDFVMSSKLWTFSFNYNKSCLALNSLISRSTHHIGLSYLSNIPRNDQISNKILTNLRGNFKFKNKKDYNTKYLNCFQHHNTRSLQIYKVRTKTRQNIHYDLLIYIRFKKRFMIGQFFQHFINKMTETEQTNIIETEVSEKNPNVLEVMKQKHKEDNIDRMNKDIQPKAKEGYEYKFGKNGWRQQKIITEEEKQAKGQQLKQAKQLKAQAALQQDQSQDQTETIKDLQKQLKQISEQLFTKQKEDEVKQPIKIMKTKKQREVRVVDQRVNSILQNLGYSQIKIEEYSE